MSTVSHASLTGADLHEPKGAASAASGTILVANGSGATSWQTPATLTGDVGELKAFITPLVPTGFLECDGSTPLRSSYLNLFNAMSIQQTGSHNSGVATITGLSDTSGMKAGYFVGGSGITNGTTILTVDSPTQITMSANATSTGSSTVIVSPWALGNGSTTFTLPDMTSTGRFPRARTSSVGLGSYQSNLIKNHVHSFTTNTDGGGGAMNSGTESVSHTHTAGPAITGSSLIAGPASGSANPQFVNVGSTQTTSAENATHFHTVSLVNHAHAGTTDNNTSGGSETRPEAVSVIWCVRY